MNEVNLNAFISEALAIEAREAKEAGALGFMARALVQSTLPHSRVRGNEFKRRNGAFKLVILADSEVGLPYGVIPRLLMAWLTTEVVRTRQREIVLGNTLSHFMTQIGLVPTGGRWGSITRLREQMKRLFTASISCTYDNGSHWAIQNVQPVIKANLWWHPKAPQQATLFESSLTLGEEFFKEVINHPIPIDIDALKLLKKSPMALDIYCWLTYRMSYLKARTAIPWAALQTQFGADYALNAQGLRNFRRAFVRELRKVSVIYRRSRFDINSDSLILKSSAPHIPTLSHALSRPQG